MSISNLDLTAIDVLTPNATAIANLTTIGLPTKIVHGVFTCDGQTEVDVLDVNLTANSIILLSPNTNGAVDANVPFITNSVPATGFRINCAGANADNYNYAILIF